MKIITLYVAVAQEDLVLDQVRRHPAVTEFTLIRAERHSARSELVQSLALTDRVAGHVPCSRIELLVDDASVESVLSAVRTSGSGASSGSSYTITSIDIMGPL